jgi:hypothetical protein
MEQVIAPYLGKYAIKRLGYSRVNMDLGRDINAKVK